MNVRIQNLTKSHPLEKIDHQDLENRTKNQETRITNLKKEISSEGKKYLQEIQRISIYKLEKGLRLKEEEPKKKRRGPKSEKDFENKDFKKAKKLAPMRQKEERRKRKPKWSSAKKKAAKIKRAKEAKENRPKRTKRGK